ncbi:hypothetical protein LSH36_586g00007 [Paralvinella palmiformis]|uniref:Uncharacterized protein n=1 Tax=Paralvinella palmiformis TaxID=53620 RepID=A0AAD9MXL6_9ANNE|nr:hypothetical protein LSH36_586g00007 [Paralvinella palmiformis]
MCAAITCPPIRELHSYSPCFKVEVCLQQPLWPVHDAVYEVLSLCSQLDILCAREILQANKEKRAANHISENFSNKAQLVIEQLNSLTSRLPNQNLTNYLETVGVTKLYPRAVRYLSKPGLLPTDITWSPMDDHIEALAAMQRLHGLASQIHQDMLSLNNHKYIAHQLSLLHQALSVLSQVSCMAELKQNIESHFTTIKRCIGDLQDQGQTPYLAEENKQWLKDLTSRILSICGNPPPEINQCLYPAVTVLRRARTDIVS